MGTVRHNMPKEAKKSKPKGDAKPKGPKLIYLVMDAIKNDRHNRKGTSRPIIYKSIGNARPGTSMAAVRNAISKAIADDVLVYGETKARFKLTDKAREMLKPQKPKKKKKKKKKKAPRKKKKKKKKS